MLRYSTVRSIDYDMYMYSFRSYVALLRNMQRQLCKCSYLYYNSYRACISRRSQIARASVCGGKRLLYVRVSMFTASRLVREKREPRICHGQLTTSTSGGPLMEGKLAYTYMYVHVETCTLARACRCCASIRVLFWQVFSLSTLTYCTEWQVPGMAWYMESRTVY